MQDQWTAAYITHCRELSGAGLKNSCGGIETQQEVSHASQFPRSKVVL